MNKCHEKLEIMNRLIENKSNTGGLYGWEMAPRAEIIQKLLGEMLVFVLENFYINI